MLTTRSQRWRDRRCHWIPDATEIDPKQLAVDVISTKNQAAPFVRAHHYTASMPVARLSVGLFANGAQSAPSCDFGQVGERFGNVAFGIDDGNHRRGQFAPS